MYLESPENGIFSPYQNNTVVNNPVGRIEREMKSWTFFLERLVAIKSIFHILNIVLKKKKSTKESLEKYNFMDI